MVIEEEVISEQADCYQESNTTDERTSVTQKEQEWIEKGESYEPLYAFEDQTAFQFV